MKVTFKTCITLSVFLLSCSWMSKPQPTLDEASWLLGTWKNKTSRGIIYENWRKISTQEYVGKSYKLNGQDTVLLETVRLIQEGDNLFYIPTVSNQNGGLPIRFHLQEQSASKLLFSNPEHDFPQYISYTHIEKDSLVAEIYGSINGKEQKRSFPMSRIQ